MNAPSTNGDNGRDRRGRFAAGNSGGPGNPHAKRVAQIRAAILNAVNPKEIEKAARKLLADAVAGDRFAFAELLDRTIGKAVASDMEERLERLEQLLSERQASEGH